MHCPKLVRDPRTWQSFVTRESTNDDAHRAYVEHRDARRNLIRLAAADFVLMWLANGTMPTRPGDPDSIVGGTSTFNAADVVAFASAILECDEKAMERLYS